MRKRFEQELQQLNEDLILMGTLNERSLEKVIEMFEDLEPSNMERIHSEVREFEIQVDDLERNVQGQALRLLFTQQPVAGDLRNISTAQRIATDMERISDQACDIAETALYFKGQALIKPPIHITDMIHRCIDMVNRSVDAFVTRNREVAQSVIAADDEVDRLFLHVRDELIDRINRDRESGEQAIDFMIIAKYLERIADHAVNIAQWVIFNITGIHKDQKLL